VCEAIARFAGLICLLIFLLLLLALIGREAEWILGKTIGRFFRDRRVYLDKELVSEEERDRWGI
jgi:hypothetical protein